VIFDQILDDAALFPPGEAPAEGAVPAHVEHRRSARARYVGPFIAPASRTAEIATLAAVVGGDRLDIALTFSGGPDTVAETLARAADLDHIRVAAVEVAIPAGLTVSAAMSTLTAVMPESVRTFVEVPRDERRGELIAALADTGLRAKFRTGGVTADAYPDEPELANAIHRSVTRGVAFKATAGLHHAVRNTDAATGFEQHGFLNIIAAVAAAADGSGPDDLAAILRSRDGIALAESVADLTGQQATDIRRRFLSFGTCSIVEPLEDLARLGLLPAVAGMDAQGVNA
jgi:hypothetical protein